LNLHHDTTRSALVGGRSPAERWSVARRSCGTPIHRTAVPTGWRR